MAGRLENKVAVITGAGSGIGLACATQFSDEGAAVACVDLHLETATAAADAITAAGGQAIAFAADVADSALVDAAFDATSDAFGPVTTVVNSAGVAFVPGDGGGGGPAVSITQLTDEGLRRMMDIHVGGMVFTARAAIRQMHEAGIGGSIIGLSSIAGLAGMGPVHYSTAKAAVLGLIKSVAREVGSTGIRLNAICPGLIDTPMTQVIPPEFLQPLINATPLRRMGTADDIAATALFLASDESSFLTGQALSPNGGLVTS